VQLFYSGIRVRRSGEHDETTGGECGGPALGNEAGAREELKMPIPVRSRMPRVYSPEGIPLYWMNELGFELKDAMHAYLEHRANEAQIVLVADYLSYVIGAPCWRGDDLPALREAAGSLDSQAAIDAWLDRCMKIGLDLI
jgi:hypothetical protein